MLGLSSVSGKLAFTVLLDAASLQAIKTYTILPLVAGALCVSVLPKLKQAFNHRLRARRTAQLIETVLLTVVVILSILNLVADSYNPFLYFRF